jgi:streptogramin lyase
VWVGLRGARLRPFPRPAVVRIDPRSGEIVRTVEIARGVQDLAVGAGAVWVTNRASDTITRVDVRTGAQRIIGVGRGPAGIALGGGSVWVANSEDSTVTRIERTPPYERATLGVAGQPRFLAYGGGSLWVSTFATSTVVRIDGETGRPAGDPIDVALNPTKLAVAGRTVYVVSAAGGRLERIAFGTE